MEQYNFEGFKNLDDVRDSTTWEQIDQEVNQEILMRQVSLDFDREVLDIKKAKLLESFERNVLQILQEWKSAVDDLIRDESRISPRIRDFLKEHRLDLPSFKIQLKERSDKFLKEVGIDDEISEDNFLVTFNLPKPMAQYWWKGGVEEWDVGARDVRGMSIKWGYMYRRLIPIVWDLTDRPENSEVYMERINPIGIHDPKKYYYIWEMSDKPRDFQEMDW